MILKINWQNDGDRMVERNNLKIYAVLSPGETSVGVGSWNVAKYCVGM